MVGCFLVLCWIGVLLGAAIGGYTLIDTTVRATSAPQQAAGAAVAVAWVVIPYCWARAVWFLSGAAPTARRE